MSLKSLFLAVFAVTTLSVFADDTKQGLPGIPSQILEHALESRGVLGMNEAQAEKHLKQNEAFHVRRGLMASPGNEKSDVGVYTYCLTDSNGIVLKNEGPLTSNKWRVKARDGKGQSIDVTDGVVAISTPKPMKFEETVKNTGGFVSRLLEVHVYAVKLDVSSATTDIANMLVGCTMQRTKHVVTTTMCYEVHPKPFR